MADRLLVLVPHEHTHAPRSILELARNLGPDLTEMRDIKHTMQLIAQSSCIADGAQAKMAREGWPGLVEIMQNVRYELLTVFCLGGVLESELYTTALLYRCWKC